MKPSQRLTGKTVVLTGASRGIGLEISRVFAQQGANLIGIARSQEALDCWATEMSTLGVQSATIAFNLRDTQSLSSLADSILRAAKGFDAASPTIDILINNAGVEIYRAFQEYTLEEIETVIRVNLLSVMGLTRLLMPYLAADGRIVNMASLASKKGHPYDSAYAASKAGLLMWGNSLRQELADSGLSVCAICPGYVSDQGMLADTGVKAPWLAGRSPAKAVAQATLKATLRRKAEVIVNQDPITEFLTRLLVALEQLFPRLADLSNRLMGITRLNQQRIRQPIQPAEP